MAKVKNSESFTFLVAVGVVATVIGGLILAFMLSESFRWLVLLILRYGWGALAWFFTASYALPVWLIALLSGIALWSVCSAIARSNQQALLESEEYKTSYLHYVTDTFDGIIWSWRYMGERPYGLYPICAHDNTPMVYTVGNVEQPNFTRAQMIWLHCETCDRETGRMFGSNNAVIDERIQRQILRKIHSKEYLQLIAKDNAAK